MLELKNIKNDLLLISYLSYIVELTSQIIKQTEDYKSLYKLYPAIPDISESVFKIYTIAL